MLKRTVVAMAYLLILWPAAPARADISYTGRENDATDLYYYRARYYRPSSQRFITEDPIGLWGGINLYAYTLNAPLNLSDPLGLDVTITRWRCCGGFDHIGIGVGKGVQPTVGFYPRTPHTPFDAGVVVADLDRQPLGDLKETLVITTTAEQDRLIQAYIEERSRRPGRYNLAGRNCGTFVQDALAAGGISPVGPVAGPGSFFDLLKAMKDAGVDFTGGMNSVNQ